MQQQYTPMEIFNVLNTFCEQFHGYSDDELEITKNNMNIFYDNNKNIFESKCLRQPQLYFDEDIANNIKMSTKDVILLLIKTYNTYILDKLLKFTENSDSHINDTISSFMMMLSNEIHSSSPGLYKLCDIVSKQLLNNVMGQKLYKFYDYTDIAMFYKDY